jgi:hypothetical protein
MKAPTAICSKVTGFLLLLLLYTIAPCEFNNKPPFTDENDPFNVFVSRAWIRMSYLVHRT